MACPEQAWSCAGRRPDSRCERAVRAMNGACASFAAPPTSWPLLDILASCVAALRPGGMVALTARPWRRREELVDFPGALTRLAEQAGLVPFERNAALLVGLRDDQLVPRPSFFQLDLVRKARRRGLPLRLIAHEDVLVFRRPGPELTAPRSHARR
jgi:hypothetical protein